MPSLAATLSTIRESRQCHIMSAIQSSANTTLARLDCAGLRLKPHTL